jgi:hypothetical protein
VAVATSGVMFVIVDLARSIAPCGQSDPGADRSRPLEVGRVLDRADDRSGGPDADAGNGHKQLVGIAAPGVRQQLASQLRGAMANGVPSLEQRPNDPAEVVVIGENRRSENRDMCLSCGSAGSIEISFST